MPYSHLCGHLGCDQHPFRRESGAGDRQNKPKYAGPPELKEMELPEACWEGGEEEMESLTAQEVCHLNTLHL